MKRLFVSAEMSIEQSFGDTSAMARLMASETSGSMCSELFSEYRASSVDAEEEDDGGIALLEYVADASCESSNSSKASESSISRLDAEGVGDLIRSGASRWR